MSWRELTTQQYFKYQTKYGQVLFLVWDVWDCPSYFIMNIKDTKLVWTSLRDVSALTYLLKLTFTSPTTQVASPSVV